jgi:ParB/RepB/Spo0J family partition protein
MNMADEQRQVLSLPIETCEVHPRAQIRFSYDENKIKKLAQSIELNGQLQPGWAVKRSDGNGYRIYVGVRRYLACKLLYEQERKVTKYLAFLNEKEPSVEEFYGQILAENFSDEGGREPLSVMEELNIFSRVARETEGDEEIHVDRIAKRVGYSPQYIARLQRIMKNIGGEERMLALGKIQQQANENRKEDADRSFRFTAKHLEQLLLWGNDSDSAFFRAAAMIAEKEVPASDITEGFMNAWAAQVPQIKWFQKEFPQYCVSSKLMSSEASLPRDQDRLDQGKITLEGTHSQKEAQGTEQEEFDDDPMMNALNTFGASDNGDEGRGEKQKVEEKKEELNLVEAVGALKQPLLFQCKCGAHIFFNPKLPNIKSMKQYKNIVIDQLLEDGRHLEIPHALTFSFIDKEWSCPACGRQYPLELIPEGEHTVIINGVKYSRGYLSYNENLQSAGCDGWIWVTFEGGEYFVRERASGKKGKLSDWREMSDKEHELCKA